MSSRRHHYFPQFHLAFFADSSSRVWTYDKFGKFIPNPRTIATVNIGLEGELYEDNHPEEPLGDVEKWLADEVDGPASAALQKVARLEGAISQKERADIARYVLSRELRTPKVRDLLMSFSQHGMENWLQGIRNHPERFRDDVLAAGGPELELDDIRAFVNDQEVVVRKTFWLDFMKEHSIRGMPKLLSQGWALFRAENGTEFLTSDLGIVKHRRDFLTPVEHDVGWANNDGGWLMPITPNLALAMAPGLDGFDRIARQPFLDRFNTVVARQATRFIFARNGDTITSAWKNITAT